MTRQDSDFFRKEALAAYRAGKDGAGDPLRIAPSWMRWTFWLLIGVVASGLAFSWFARIDEYAMGRAAVRVRSVGSAQTCTLVGVIGAQQAVDLSTGSVVLFLPDHLPGTTEVVEIRHVAGELLGASEAAALFPATPGNAPLPKPPMVKLEAPLEDCKMDLDRNEFRYHDGLTGEIQVRLRSERIIVSLVPALRSTEGTNR